MMIAALAGSFVFFYSGEWSQHSPPFYFGMYQVIFFMAPVLVLVMEKYIVYVQTHFSYSLNRCG